MRVASLAALSLLLSLSGALAGVCPATGEPAPPVVTVIASKKFPNSEAWIVKPDCRVETVVFGAFGVTPIYNPTLMMFSRGIERVDSLPRDVQRLFLDGNPLSKGANLTAAVGLDSVSMSPEVLDDVVFPDLVTALIISGNRLASLSATLPPRLVNLQITGTAITSLKGLALPSTVKSMDLSGNQLSSLEGVVFPSGLQNLQLNGNRLTKLGGVIFPTKMNDLHIYNNSLSTLDCVFPLEVKQLFLHGNQLTTLEAAVFPNYCLTLKLNDNKLTTLDCVFPLTTVNLDLSKNQLTTLRGAILPTSCLDLKLSENKLTAISNKLPVDLKTLQLDHNKFSSLKGVTLPDKLATLDLQHNSIKAIDAPLPYRLESLNLYDNQITSLEGVWLPPYVDYLDLQYNLLTSIDTTLPRQVETLALNGNRITSLTGVSLPPGLKNLYLGNNTLMALGTYLPATLVTIDLAINPLPVLELVTIADSVETIYLWGSNVTTVRGIRWPMHHLDLWLCYDGCGDVSFEIRQSDLPAFTENNVLSEGSFQQQECENPDAELVTVGVKNFCVISDERFDELYPPIEEIVLEPSFNPPSNYYPQPIGETDPPQATETPSTEPPQDLQLPDDGDAHSSSGSGSDSGSGFVGDDIDTSLLATVPKSLKAPRAPTATEEPEQSKNDDVNASADDASTGNDTRGGKKSTKTSKSPAPSKPNSTEADSNAESPAASVPVAVSTLSASVLPIAIASVAVAICLLVGACAYRLVVVNQRKKTTSGDSGQYSSLESPTIRLTTDPPVSVFLADDIRNDERFMAFHLDQSLVQVGNELTRSGSGAVYRGVLQGRDVIVKRIDTSTADSDRALANFMNEIRMYASLDHPKIVAFVGFVWSGRQTLSTVVEFMASGDLQTVLHNEEAGGSPEDWTAPWTANKINSKASIAQDVTEAVVYLHSLQTPVIHRDLKARNVFLDAQGNAKLSGFSISRETSVDETMTREVGSAAWMAPEVLRGERYDEKADIYSLGVLLVELDRCQHPYANDGIVMANTEMARLVSEGQLHPKVSSACPEAIALLAAQCLNFEAESRPTALEVAHAIRQIRKRSSRHQRSPPLAHGN